MKAMLTRVREEALLLLPQLLVGLDDKAFKMARDVVLGRLLELAVKYTKENDLLIKGYLKERRLEVVGKDEEEVEDYMMTLPRLTSTVKEWVNRRQTNVMEDLTALLGDYKVNSSSSSSNS